MNKRVIYNIGCPKDDMMSAYAYAVFSTFYYLIKIQVNLGTDNNNNNTQTLTVAELAIIPEDAISTD